MKQLRTPEDIGNAGADLARKLQLTIMLVFGDTEPSPEVAEAVIMGLSFTLGVCVESTPWSYKERMEKLLSEGIANGRKSYRESPEKYGSSVH